MRRLRLSISCIILFLISSVSHATTVQRLHLDDLVRKANTIVVGKATKSRSFWNSNHKLILTTYTLEIQETIKGERSRTVEVTTIGGTVGDVTLQVAGMPSFAPGENAVVFIEYVGGFATVVGLEQGKFAVRNGEVSNRMTGLSFPDGQPAKSLNMPLDSFKRQLKVLLDRQP